MKSLELVKKYLANTARIEKISKEKDIREEEAQDQIRAVRNRYDEEIGKIETVRDDEIHQLNESRNEYREQTDKETRSLYEHVENVHRILQFFKLKHGDLEVHEENITVGGNREIENLGVFYDDDYLKIKLFIVENRKPKNKYSLEAFGKCLFGEKLLKLPKSYGCNGSDWRDRCNLRLGIKDFPSKEELKKYLEKNKGRILSNAIGEYEKVKSEYSLILENYSKDDFENLLDYNCAKCGFFLTVKEAQGYSLHDNKCPLCETKRFKKLRMGGENSKTTSPPKETATA